MYILNLEKNELVKVEIVAALPENVPLKKDGWKFNWRQLIKVSDSQTFMLKKINGNRSIEGMLQLIISNGMLIMEVIEIAPKNIGKKNKRYDYVAGCLIAFACRESFKLTGNYKGFLTFISKTNLIELYSVKYRATLALRQRMFIDPESGLKLIEEYLNNKKE